MIEFFNQRAHDILINLLDVVEDDLIERGICGPMEVSEYLTAFYIRETSDFLRYAIAYLPDDGRIAADIVISKMANSQRTSKYMKHATICGKQLALHTELYFPRFAEMLTKAYVEALRTCDELYMVMTDGIILLAAARLPGVQVSLRREFRRRGLSYDRFLVSDDLLSYQKRAALAPQHFDGKALLGTGSA
jgi:hypothetical protein